MNSNSPAFPEAFSGDEATRVQIDRAEAVGVSGVASRTDASLPLDSSVVGAVVTPSSGYLDAMRAAGVIKAARGRDLQGDAADAQARSGRSLDVGNRRRAWPGAHQSFWSG